MDLNYKTVNIFPVPVHQFDVNGFSEIQDELIDYVYKMREKDPVGDTISNRRGWQSSCFSLENEDDILQNFLTNCLSEFPPIEKYIKLFVSAWININPPNAFNLKHNHPQHRGLLFYTLQCPMLFLLRVSDSQSLNPEKVSFLTSCLIPPTM